MAVATGTALAIGAATGLAGAAIGANASKKAATSQANSTNKAIKTQADMWNQQRQDLMPWRNIGTSSLGQLGYLMGLQGYGNMGSYQPQAPAVSQGSGMPVGTLQTLGMGVTSPDALGRGGDLRGNQLAMLAANPYGPEGSIVRGDLAMPVPDPVGTQGGAGQTGQPQAQGSTFSPGGFGDFNRSFSMADFQADPGYAFRMAEGQKALERSASARGSLFSGGQLKALTRYGQDMGSQEYGNAYNRWNNDQTTRFNRLATLAGIGQTATSQLGQAGQNFANNQSNLLGQLGNAQAAGTVGAANAWNQGIGNAFNAWTQWSMLNDMKG